MRFRSPRRRCRLPARPFRGRHPCSSARRGPFSLESLEARTLLDGIGVLENPPPGITIADVQVLEGSAEAVFTVTLDAQSAGTVTVNYGTNDATAVAGTDYEATSGVLTFDPMQTEQTISVPLLGTDDNLVEAHTSFWVVLSDASGGLIDDGAAEATLQDDDVPKLAIGNAEVEEGGDLVFTVAISQQGTDVDQARLAASQVSYMTANGTAVSGQDYTASSGTLTIDPFATETTIAVTTIDDVVDENGETLFVNLLSPVAADIADAQGVGTLLDNDPLPQLSIGDAMATEGDDLVFLVTLSGPSGSQVTVNYTTIALTATSGEDFEPQSGTLTFEPGVEEMPIPVVTLGDALDEDDDTLRVTLSNPSGAGIDDGVGDGTITDDDPEPTISIADPTIEEGHTGTSNVAFTVSLSAPSGKTITVDYATADDSATAGDDYQSVAGQLTFVPGQTEATVVVPVIGDLVDEGDEQFVVNLSGAQNASIDVSAAAATITDDDFRHVSSDVPQDIADQSAVFSRIEVPDRMVIVDLEVALDITHTNVADLSAYLIAPDGRFATLFSGVGGWGQDFTGTVLDDEAGTSIGDGEAPFTGTFRPQALLSAFDGYNAQGTWTLEIFDSATGDVGTLDHWELIVHTTTADALDLGAITRTTVEDLNPQAEGDLWLTVEPTRTGLLTVDAGFAEDPDAVSLTLYDQSQNKLTVSQATDGGQRLDWSASAGQTYHLKVSGSSTDVDLTLANLVNRSGTNLTVLGTSGDDVLEVDTSVGVLVTIDGVEYDFAPGEITSVSFNGALGDDSATVLGSTADEAAVLSPLSASVTGGPATVQLGGVETIRFVGGGGSDTATMNDSSGDDQWTADPSQAILSGEGFSNQVEDVDMVFAYARNGGHDTADLTGSDGDDHFLGDGQVSWLDGPGFFLRAKFFDEVVAHAGEGETDLARLRDGPGNDIFRASPESGSMTGAGFYYRADGFDYLRGYGYRSGIDMALITDSPGNDEYRGDTGQGELRGDSFSIIAKTFHLVQATSVGGYDIAYLWGSTGKDQFTGRPGYSEISGSGFQHRTLDFRFVRAFGYERSEPPVEGEPVETTDVAQLFDSAGPDNYSAEPLWGSLWGNGFTVQADHFYFTHGYGTPGTNDTAQLNDSPGNDELVGRPEWTSLSGDGFFLRAKGFDEVHANAANGGQDTATLRDSAGNDHFTADPAANLATLEGDSYLIRAELFDRVIALAYNAGNDEALLDDSPLDDLLEAQDNWASLTGRANGAIAYFYQVFDFDPVTARSDSGGNDTTAIDPDVTFLDLEGDWQ